MKPQIRLQSLIAVAAKRKAITAIVPAEKEKEKVVDCIQQSTEGVLSLMAGTVVFWLMGAIVTELMGLGQVVNLLWAVSVCLILLYYSHWYCRI